MEAFHVSNQIIIQSHKGKYSVNFIQSGMERLNAELIEDAIYIIDENIALCYKDRLNNVLNSKRVILIAAREDNKSLDKFTGFLVNSSSSIV